MNDNPSMIDCFIAVLLSNVHPFISADYMPTICEAGTVLEKPRAEPGPRPGEAERLRGGTAVC